MKENKTCLRKEFAEMSTAQLDETLQQELQKEDPEEEVVLGILRILEEREAGDPVFINQNVSNAWKEYNKRTVPPKKNIRKRIWFASVAAVAAVICVVVMAIPRTVGAESLFDVLFRWTGSVFEFFTPEQNATNPPVEYLFETENPGLQQLYDEVTGLGITDPVVPMWLPEGFVLSEQKNTPTRGGNKVFVKFKNGSDGVAITYRISTDITASFEKEESAVEVFESGDVSHFIMDNDENLSATWTVDGVECSILTDIDREDVYNMIKSIYRRPLE